jgi:hypothetical protein
MSSDALAQDKTVFQILSSNNLPDGKGGTTSGRNVKTPTSRKGREKWGTRRCILWAPAGFFRTIFRWRNLCGFGRWG